MISQDHVVNQLCRMMGNEKGMYGIEWSLDRESGYRAIVNGVGLYLCECHGFSGSPDGRSLYLFIFNDEARAQIVEPAMHVSCVPIGKFLRQVTSAIGMDPWPRLPETSKEEANEKLRIALNKLHSRACEQDDLRASGAILGEDLRVAIARRMFRKDFFVIPECGEEVRQQLFRELLRLKPVTA